MSGTLADRKPGSLRGLLRRAHIMVALAAVAIVGVVISIPALATLRFYAHHEVRLVTRAISQTVEAAVVFGDTDAAQEALASIVIDEDVAEAVVTGRNGRVLAHWHDGGTGWETRLGAITAGLLHEKPSTQPVLHDGATVGGVQVTGGGRTLVRFLLMGGLALLLCQVLVAAGALYVSNRILGRIVVPLQTLVDVTSTAQRDRAFGRRVPHAGIAELDALGSAYNAMLGELQSWQVHMTGENERLFHQASHDSLTGLPNRAVFEGRLDRAVQDARNTDTSVAVMLIDCDDFKQINDRLGHSAGDAVLVAIASRLKARFRARDLVARLGGDEFAVLIAPSQSGDDLAGLARTAAQAMRLPIPVRDAVAVSASISIGIAIFPDQADCPETLLDAADEAMYRAKRQRAVTTSIQSEIG